jgi:hypothetical protein
VQRVLGLIPGSSPGTDMTFRAPTESGVNIGWYSPQGNRVKEYVTNG